MGWDLALTLLHQEQPIKPTKVKTPYKPRKPVLAERHCNYCCITQPIKEFEYVTDKGNVRYKYKCHTCRMRHASLVGDSDD